MKNTTKLAIVLCISSAFFITEIAIGFKTKSLALIADAFHYLTDIISYALAYAAARLQAEGQRTQKFSYAFQRGELLGSFFNGVFLLALALSIFLQSIERFVHVERVDNPVYVLIVGGIGLVLNILSALVVHDHHGHGNGSDAASTPQKLESGQVASRSIEMGRKDRPVRPEDFHNLHNHVTSLPVAVPEKNLGLLAVMIHLLGDAVNNIGVMIAAIIIWRVKSDKRFYADPAVSLAISLIIFASAVPLTKRTGTILLQATPPSVDVKSLEEDLNSVRGVAKQGVHDTHIWQLSQNMNIGTFHVRLTEGVTLDQWEEIEEVLQECAAAHNVGHCTFSPEPERPADSIRGLKTKCEANEGCAVNDSTMVDERKQSAAPPPPREET